MDTFDFDLDLFIKSFVKAGATVKKGNGKIYVNGEETDIVSAIKRGLNDIENDFFVNNNGLKHASVSYNLSANNSRNCPPNLDLSKQMMIAA